MIFCRSRWDLDSCAFEGAAIWVDLMGVFDSCWPKVSGSKLCETVPLNLPSMLVWAYLLPRKIISDCFACSSSALGSTGFSPEALLEILILLRPTFLF